MKMITKLALGCAMLTGLSATAAPVEYDTPDAHIVVIRPMDQWIPDASLAKSLDKDYFKDEYMGQYSVSQKEYFTLGSDEPFAVLFRSKYPNKEFARWRMSIGSGAPVSVSPTEMANFVNVQNSFYAVSVIAQGNPSTLPARINTNQIWRNVLTLATIGLAGAAGGGNFAAAIAGSPIPNEIASVSSDAQKVIVRAKTSKIDYSKYKNIDARITFANGNIVGQIIIAYKTEKTQAAEDEALAIGLASTLGFDTTKEATMASRAADLADRQAIWDKCVADGKCKNEE